MFPPAASGHDPARSPAAPGRLREESPERPPSFDEMLDGCILRLIHKLPPTDLAPQRDRR